MPYALPKPTTTQTEKPKAHRDSLRELVETFVFVVVLVLMLKLFVVEAFVIPTGSMAETELGYHKNVQCEQCGYKFPVNSSDEEEGRKGVKVPIVGYHCPNCNFPGKLKVVNQGSKDAPFFRTELESTSGDRVLVHKAMPINQRGSVVVFKFPKEPQIDQIAQNYIKRLVGFGGETIAIYHGKLFVHKSLEYPKEQYPRPPDEKDVWQERYTYPQAEVASTALESAKQLGFPENAKGFELIRKPDNQVLAMKRIVYDNDHQAQDLIKLGVPPRWKTSGTGWDAAVAGQTSYNHTGPERAFLKYEHLVVKNKAIPDVLSSRTRDLPKNASDFIPTSVVPSKITNLLGYNSGVRGDFHYNDRGTENSDNNDHWVGDLIVECKAMIADPTATVILDLARGPSRFQAQFANGTVKLVRTGAGGKELASRPTTMTKAGQYALRFANVDCRLRVWVDDKAIDFGKESDYAYEAPKTFDNADSKHEGWTTANDINEPAAIEVQGNVTISNITLWRDTYYTHNESGPRGGDLDTYYVHPGHFLCFGDNSAQSSDGRTWGQVPERLMLGRAVFVFWPFARIGFIN